MMYITVEGSQNDSVSLDEPETTVFEPPRYLVSLLNITTDQLYSPEVAPSVNWDNGMPLQTANPNLQADNKTMTTGFEFVRPFGNPTGDPIPPQAYVLQPVRYSIQNMTFSEVPFAAFPVAEIIQLQMYGISNHPWHMHINPAEVTSYGFTDYYERWGGFFDVGDFQDVFQLPVSDWPDHIEFRQKNGFPPANFTAMVRFQTDYYTGALVMHCHVLYHEDLGMMTWFNMTGENLTVNNMFQNHGSFATPPPQCMKDGQQCAPAYCTDYEYGSPAVQ
jgi:FtsP/CotA-like multicopper oxidase with cupredoxin domain